MENFRVYVVNIKNRNGIVSCGSREDAEQEFENCHSIDGGATYLQGYCPLIGWANIKGKI